MSRSVHVSRWHADTRVYKTRVDNVPVCRLLSDCADWSEGLLPTFSKLAGWLPLLPFREITFNRAPVSVCILYQHRTLLTFAPTLAEDWWPAGCLSARSWGCVLYCAWSFSSPLHLCCWSSPLQAAQRWHAEEGSGRLGERWWRPRPWRWADARPRRIGSEQERCQSDLLQTGTVPESSPVTQIETDTHVVLIWAFKIKYGDQTG